MPVKQTKSTNNRKHIAVIGSGKMTGPIIDYFIDTCQYKVTVADISVEQPKKLIKGRELGKVARWSVNEPETIDKIVKEVDIVVSMVPKPIHIHVAKPCLRHGKSMITTSYEIPELMALDSEARALVLERRASIRLLPSHIQGRARQLRRHPPS